MGAGTIIAVIFLVFFLLALVAGGIVAYMYFFLPGGAKCRWDLQCKSGSCGGNLGGLKGGTCKGNGTNTTGANCNSDGDCANGVCSRPNADTTQKICCPSGNHVYRWADGRWYCTDMPTGTSCIKDQMCSSGKCKNKKCT